MTDEWTTLQAALAFGGFQDAAETERVTLWVAEEIERLREALRFYADPATWDTLSPHGTVTMNTLARQDNGGRARHALKGQA